MRVAVLLALILAVAACQTNGPCTGVNNTPQAGWTQLFQRLNGDLITWQSLQYETDFTWAN